MINKESIEFTVITINNILNFERVISCTNHSNKKGENKVRQKLSCAKKS
jgi:hypothetical protein